MSKTLDWVVSWFHSTTKIPESEIRESRDKNYFEAGWIDSLAFINLISDIEQKFGITFSNDDFQDRKFSTINGLSETIEAHLSENES